MKIAVLTVAAVAYVHGHGALVSPLSRNAIDYKVGVGCDAHVDSCGPNVKGNGCVNTTHPLEPCHNGQASFWYSQGCFIGCPSCDGASGRRQTDLCGLGFNNTLPDYARSVNRNATIGSELDIYKHNPWRAPGFAPVADACGLAGGAPTGPNGAEAGNYYNTSFAHHGQAGTTLPPLPTGTKWKIGGEANVSWQVRNNHGGGYSYRLCPASEPLTEECFQKYPLDMIPEKASLLFPDGGRLSIDPVIVTKGTSPAGSMWARIPVAPTALGPFCIPGPNDDPKAPHSCASQNNPTTPCGCTQCPQTPGSDCSRCDNCGEAAYSPYVYKGQPVEGVSPVVGIADVLKIPSHLPAGDFVLGWRYDCEATAQVWSNCADITLVK